MFYLVKERRNFEAAGMNCKTIVFTPFVVHCVFRYSIPLSEDKYDEIYQQILTITVSDFYL
jgi:hypothetical protein